MTSPPSSQTKFPAGVVVVVYSVLFAIFCVDAATAFVPVGPNTANFIGASTFSSSTRQQSIAVAKSLHLFGGGVDNNHLAGVFSYSSFLSASSESSYALHHQLNNFFLLATIDSDIAKISDNEFAPIFAGGILVMFGGVISALIVGFILESRGLYANVIADSYAQGADDEEFWKGLSDEEKRKTQELLQKLKESKDTTGERAQRAPPAPAAPTTETVVVSSLESSPNTGAAAETAATPEIPEATTQEKSSPQEAATKSTESKNSGMFSDY